MLLQLPVNAAPSNLLPWALAATKENNEKFLASKLLDTAVATTASENVVQICAIQGESALMSLGSHYATRERMPHILVGSEDATTCIIVIIHERTCNSFFACHVDEASVDDVDSFDEALEKMVKCSRDNNASPSFALYLVGGYDEPKRAGPTTARKLLNYFHHNANTLAFDLRLCAVSSSNTNPKTGFPIARSMIMDTRTGEVTPRLFSNLGPELARRHATRTLSASHQLNAVVCYNAMYYYRCSPENKGNQKEEEETAAREEAF